MALKIPPKKKPAGKPRAPKESPPQPGRYAHVAIVEQDVVLLQLTPAVMLDPQDVVFNVFDCEREQWRAGAAWLAFLGTGMPHFMGKTTWIGLSKSVPLPVIDFIQSVFTNSDMQVEREMGRVLRLGLNPFARVSADGLEILVPGALVSDPNKRRVVERAGTTPIARGYTISPQPSVVSAEKLWDLIR